MGNGVDDPITRRLNEARMESNRLGKRLREVDHEIRDLQEERENLLRDSARISGKIEALEGLIEEHENEQLVQTDEQWEELAGLGLKECCYRVLAESDQPLETTQIQERLEARGLDMKDYANPLAVIHTTLKRMPDKVRATKRKLRGGNGQSRWISFYEAIKPAAEAPSKQ